MDDRAAHIIEQADWPQIALALYDHADWLIRRHVWQGTPAGTSRRGIAMANGKDAKDYGDEAIASLFDASSKRHWDPERQPDLLSYLKWTVRSMISNASKELENRETVRQYSGTVDAETGEPADRLAQIGSEADSPSHRLLHAEREATQKRLLDAFRRYVADDPELAATLEAYEAGISRPREIAELTGMTVDRVYELKRKLTTRMDSFMQGAGIGKQEVFGVSR